MRIASDVQFKRIIIPSVALGWLDRLTFVHVILNITQPSDIFYALHVFYRASESHGDSGQQRRRDGEVPYHCRPTAQSAIKTLTKTKSSNYFRRPRAERFFRRSVQFSSIVSYRSFAARLLGSLTYHRSSVIATLRCRLQSDRSIACFKRQPVSSSTTKTDRYPDNSDGHERSALPQYPARARIFQPYHLPVPTAMGGNSFVEITDRYR